MEYRWRCTKCSKECIKAISIEEYDKEKLNQVCPSCGSKLERVIEWNGPATNLGGYSDVAGNAHWQQS